MSLAEDGATLTADGAVLYKQYQNSQNGTATKGDVLSALGTVGADAGARWAAAAMVIGERIDAGMPTEPAT